MDSIQTSASLGQQSSWLLYTCRSTQPLVGFIQARNRDEVVTWAAAHAMPSVIAVPVEGPYPSEQRSRIEHQYQLFHTIVPASSDDTTRPYTSYFYRKQAIAWAGMARRHLPQGGFYAICVRLAKSYLATYRDMKGIR